MRNKRMAYAKFKQKCSLCKENFVLVTNRTGYPVCYDCQKEQLSKEIEDPIMKKLFDIPEVFYKESPFLRDIKINYIKWQKLSEAQVEAFKKVVNKIYNEKVDAGEMDEIKRDESGKRV